MSSLSTRNNVLVGRMRQRIRIEAPVLAADGLGGAVRSWEEVATVWAELRAVSGEERYDGGALISRTAYRIVMRYRSDLSSEMRIVFGARVFAIRAILERGVSKRSLEILAEEGVGS